MYLVFDIGGTHMRIGISSDGDTITRSKIVPTPQNFNQGIQALKQEADKLSGDERITRAAGGVPGPLNQEKSSLLSCPQIHGWINKPLQEELEKAFGTEVIVENDTVMGGIGEALKGAGAGKKVVAYIGIGTGIGGKRIVEGKISVDSSSFEPGHQMIIPNGNRCNCGSKGCWETYISGAYFPGTYQKKGEEITDPAVWDEIAKYTAMGLTNISVLWNPDIVVLGGGVSASIPLEKVKIYLGEFLKIYPQSPEIVKATLGQDAGLYGALELLK